MKFHKMSSIVISSDHFGDVKSQATRHPSSLKLRNSPTEAGPSKDLTKNLAGSQLNMATRK